MMWFLFRIAFFSCFFNDLTEFGLGRLKMLVYLNLDFPNYPLSFRDFNVVLG